MTTAGKAAGAPRRMTSSNTATGRSPTLRQNGTPPATMPTPDWPGSRTGCRSKHWASGDQFKRQCRRHCNESRRRHLPGSVPATARRTGTGCGSGGHRSAVFPALPAAGTPGRLAGAGRPDCRGSGAGRVYRHAPDAWDRLRDAEKALAYLRQAVVNRSRSVLRHRAVVDKNLPQAPPDMPSTEDEILAFPAGATGRRGRASAACPTAARGDRAAVLRGSVRGRDRRRDAHQPRRRQEPHRSRNGCAPSRHGAGAAAT